MNRVDIVLIDADNARRAQIAAMAECIGASVAAYASRGMCAIDHPTGALYLVERKGAPARVDRPAGAHLVIFGVGPAGGASNYLAWPFGPAAIRSSLASALAESEDPGEMPGQGLLGTWSARVAGAMPWRHSR